jgi:hypothetical protein
MDPALADYIRSNRDRYTREAITEQLVQAGHSRDAIDAAWEQMAAAERPVGAGRDLCRYVWILYWLGALVIAGITVFAALSSGGPGFTAFGIGWLVAYLALTYLPARARARARPSGPAGRRGGIVVVPLVVVLIGGGSAWVR